MDQIARNLKRARLRAGLSRREVAVMIHVSEIQVGDWERATNTPRPLVLLRYVHAGLLTADEALGLVEVPEMVA